jgi:hypothetical protein
MTYDSLLNLFRIKTTLALKYERLASLACSAKKKATCRHRAERYRRQAQQYKQSLGRSSRLFQNKVHAHMRRLMGRFTVPILQETYHAMKIGGTGTLLQIDTNHFLITASHVYEAYRKGLALYLPTPNRAEQMVQITGQSHRVADLDFAIIELSPEIPPLLEAYEFVQLDRTVCTRGPVPPGSYYMLGYPTAGAFSDVVMAHISVRALVVSGPLFAGEVSEKYDSNVYVLIAAPNNEYDLDGISGCAIWQAYGYAQDAEAWSAADARIVAVETGTYDEHTIIEGTLWRHVCRVIAEKYPALVPSLALG